MSSVKTETELNSFLKAVFQGHIEESYVFPYPEIPADTKETVAAFTDAYKDFDAAFIDSDKIDHEHFFPREAIKGLGDLGALGMVIPEEYGGSGFSATAYCKTMETVGSSTRMRGRGCGFSRSVIVSPMLISSTPATAAISPASTRSVCFLLSP